MYHKDHKVFKKPDDDDIKIWRYLDFTKLVSILDKRALFFIRSDLLTDIFEGSYPKVNIENPTFKLLDEQTGENISEKLSEIRRNFRKLTFLNCWHINNYESAAMWKLYLKSDEGVAIQSTFKQLAQCFETEKHVYISEVKYIDYETDRIPENNLLYPFIYKRKSFEHEKELRAIVMESSQNGLNDETENIQDKGIYIPINLNKLIENVYLAPTAPEWFKQLLSSILDKYELNVKPKQSNLSYDPIW